MIATIADILKEHRGQFGSHVLFLGSGALLQPMRRTPEELLLAAARRWARDSGVAVPDSPETGAEEALLGLFAEEVADPAERCRLLRRELAEAKPAEGHIRLAGLIKGEYFGTIFSTSYDGMLELALENQRLLAGEEYLRVVLPGASTEEVELAVRESSRIALIKLFGDLESKALPVTLEERRRSLQPVSHVLREQSRARCVFVGFTERDLPVLEHIATTGRPVHWVSQRVPLGDRETLDELKLHTPEELPWHEYRPEAVRLLDARGSLANLLCREEGSFDAFFAELHERLIRRRRRRRQEPRSQITLLPGGPYRFLEHFDTKHADLFFGRESEVEALSELIPNVRSLVVFGPSGVGKTSLLKAGLMPALRDEEAPVGRRMLPVYCRGLEDPLADIRLALSEALEEAGVALEAEPEPTSLLDLLNAAAEAAPYPLLLLLDQFEEYHVRLGAPMRRAFLDQLAEAIQSARDDVHFLIAVREDFLGSLFELSQQAPDLYRNLYKLGRLDKAAAEGAVIKPAARFEKHFDSDLPEAIIEDLYLDGVLPAELQIVCDRLYAGLSRNQRLISLKLYEQLGGAHAIIADCIDHALAQIPRRDRQLARAILRQLITAHETRATLTVEHIASAAKADEDTVGRVLARLEDLRLVRGVGGEGEQCYELVHEYIANEITGWLSRDELRTKDVQELLARELNSWRKFHLLMHPDELRLVHERRHALRMSRDELALVIRSVARHDFEVDYWFGRVGELEDRLVPFLQSLLEDEHPQSRRLAVEALAGVQQSEAVLALIGALDDPDTEVRRAAQSALAPRDRELVALLEEGGRRLRARAAYALGQVGGRRARDALIAALEDPHPSVRECAAQALQQMPSVDATGALLRRFNDREPPPWSVAEVLGRSGDQKEIIERLVRRAPRSRESAQAHYVLGRTYLGAKRADLAEHELEAAAQLARDDEGQSLVAQARQELASTKGRGQDATWGMFRCDAPHRGSRESGPEPPLAEAWRFRTRDFVASSPALADGAVFCGARDQSLYCLEAETGDLRWRLATRGRVESSPAVDGSRVYVGSHDGGVYCLDANTGRTLWRADLGQPVRSSCNVAEGLVVVGCWDKAVHALHADTGERAWRHATDGEVYASPAISSGVIAIGSWDRCFRALDLHSGELLWRHETQGEIYSSAAVAEGAVVFGCDDGQVYALDLESGRPRWQHATGGRVRSSPAIGKGLVFVGSQDGCLYALSLADGELRWRARTDEEIVSSPALAGDIVYVASRDGALYAVDARTGESAWSRKTPYGIVSSPAAAEGRLVIGMEYYHIVAFVSAEG